MHACIVYAVGCAYNAAHDGEKGLQVWGSSSRHMQLHALNSICLYLFAFHPPIQRLVQDINDVRRMRALASFELHMASQGS